MAALTPKSDSGAQYTATITINAPISKIEAYLTSAEKLATLKTAQTSIPYALLKGSSDKPAVGEAFHAEIFGAPKHFTGTFSKAGPHELEWTGSIGFLCSFEHGMLAEKDGEDKTKFTHYEKFTGGLLSFLPASIPRGIVSKNYDDFNALLKSQCEA